MGMTGLTQPYDYSAAYSYMPLRVESDNVYTSDNFKYTINITWDKVTSNTATAVSINNILYTEFITNTANNFEVGDSVFLDGGISNPQYTGYYIVQAITSSTSVTINLILEAPITGVINISKVIKYKMSSDPDGQAKLNLSNTIKDFVTQNLEDVNDIFGGPDTKFDYEIFIGEEKEYVFQFEDNGFYNSGGTTNVLFYNTAITSLVGVPFQIGDSIQIQQDEFEWVYEDNINDSGLAFSGNTIQNFLPGQIITVTGQLTEPYYNGIVTVADDNVTNTNILRVTKSHTTNTPVEGGSIFGVPRPSYNTIAQITNIYIDPTYGLIIETNQLHKGATQPIGGTIRYSDNRLTTSYNELNILSLKAYNAYLSDNDYTTNGFDPYIIKSGSSINNNLSTILENDIIHHYRIEQSTKSWLLAHAYRTGEVDRARYYFYDKNNVLLTINELINITTNDEDFYIPMGIDQLLASNNFIPYLTLPHLSGITSQVDSYSVAAFNGVTNRSNYIRFDLNDDCSKYEIYHLMWKDALGSWLSYPFKYLSRESTEYERKTYYQKKGNFNDDNTFNINSYDRGETQYYNRNRDKISLNSGWIKEFENDLIKDLLASSSVYVQLPNNNLLGCVITNKDFILKTDINDHLYQYKVDIRLSSNNYRY